LSKIVKTAVSIVAAYVGNNSVPQAELPGLFETVAKALDSVAAGKSAVAQAAAELIPAVPIKKSRTASYIICLEDGLKFKSMKRHLMAKHGLTPEQYKQRWNLPFDYQVVASDYSAARSNVAIEAGFGKRTVAEVPKKRGRKPKAVATEAN
jgi:predicted transcriptional regulator